MYKTGRRSSLTSYSSNERIELDNCYGWNGSWSYRTGWQQISDTNYGVSLEFGRAMCHNEPVTPVFPNADYSTGVADFCGIVDALMQRAEKGSSYVVDIALNYYSQWLVNSVGVYPDAVWEKLWSQHGKMIFHSEDNMAHTLSIVLRTLQKYHIDLLTNPAYYIIKRNKAVNEDFRIVKNCIQWPQDSVNFDFHIGTHPNGMEQSHWPKDLLVEIVTDTN